MTDRELIELAAKAAGVVLEWDGPPSDWQPMYYEGKTYHSFNPLESDADAFRLAVKVGIDVRHSGGCHYCETEGKYIADEVDVEGDGIAATRRAITRAAAEIGRAM